MNAPVPDSSQDPRALGGAAMLARALGRARWSIFWERLWPALASILTAFGLFLALSWLGLWLWLPPLGRAAGLFVFFVFAVAATVPLFFVRVPTSFEGLRRLDRESKLPHRPATAIADEIAPEAKDQFAVALWRAHVERALLAAKSLKAGEPAPHVASRDPYALRALVLMLLVGTFFAAGGERYKRVAAAFDWNGVVQPANFRINAWVTPPTYTGRPPQILPGLRPGETVKAAGAVSVPAGSLLVIRATGKSDLKIATTGGIAEVPGDQRPQAQAGTEERRYTISEGGAVSVRGIGDDLTWTFTAIPDRAPTIALTKEPEGQIRGSLQLAYKIEDDYGVVDGQATFERKPVANETKIARPLYSAPDFPLVLPQARTKSGVAQTIKDLSEHPWAGTDVMMTLVARDEANNEGRSQPQEVRLPERPFSKPLARALVEQRRILALDAESKNRVLLALDRKSTRLNSSH